MASTDLSSSETPNCSAEDERVERKNKEMIRLSLSSSMAKPPTPPKPPKKRSSALGLLRAALVISRGKSKGKSNKIASTEADVITGCKGKRGFWKSLLGGVRPLHAQPPQLVDSPPRLPQPLSPPSPDQSFHDVRLPPPSPEASFSSSSSSLYDGFSRYASAEDLRVLDVDEAEENGDEEGDGSPNLIDLQAEEFIARFYEQIRLQRAQSAARRSSGEQQEEN